MFENVEGIVKREMVLFFIIDQSGSMAGTKIGAVNTAIREVIPELKGIGGADVDLKIAALMFSSGCRWMHTEPIVVENFTWNNLQVSGVTDLGAACAELNDKMSRNKFMNSPSGSVAPALFLMSDGQPTDDFTGGLEKLKNNNWYKYAIRVALAIGDDADIDVLAEFTGNKEAVLTAYDPEALKQMIQFVSITSAQIGSKSQPIQGGGTPQTKQNDMIQQLQTYTQNNPAADPNNVSTSADAW
jgi:uncharacterized protein YegL